MKPNRIKNLLAEGRVPVGHMISEFGTRGIAKLVESAGADFVVVDMEHSGMDLERVADLLAWFKATPVTTIVRVPQGLYHFIARVLDAGAQGVMAPNVETPEQARAIVDAVKYAPLGHRGVGLGTAHNDYLTPEPVEFLREANNTTTVVCQIESPAGVAAAGEIAAVPGVDVLWIGQFDLTVSMAIPGQFEHPRFVESLDRVSRAARRHRKAAGIQPGTWQQAEAWLKLGFNVISWQSDYSVYRTALFEAIDRLRQHAAADAHAASEG